MIELPHKTTAAKGGQRDMDIKAIIEMIDSVFGPIDRIIRYITLIVGAITGVVFFIIKTFKNRKLKLNKDDGYYYRWNDKYSYCPECYEYRNKKAKIKNDKCIECGKVYKYPKVVVEAVKIPRSKKLPFIK